MVLTGRMVKLQICVVEATECVVAYHRYNGELVIELTSS